MNLRRIFASISVVLLLLASGLACSKKQEQAIAELKSENKVEREWSFDASVQQDLLGETTDQVYVSGGAVAVYSAGYYLLSLTVVSVQGLVTTQAYEIKYIPDTEQIMSINVSTDSSPRYVYFVLNTTASDPTLSVETDFDGIAYNGSLITYQFVEVPR